MSVLFVTSFTPELYRASGSRLVRSFLDSSTDGHLLICHEGCGHSADLRHPRLRTFALARAPLLANWLAANRDIIPKRFGGSAGRCACAEPDDPFARHRPRCPNGWFNHHAARWFRKIVALDHAVRFPEYKYFVWLDCDCEITAGIPIREVARWFADNAVFYLKSSARRVIESGVFGVRNSAAGRRFVAAVVERYRSGQFRRNLRWDDGYQLQLTLRRLADIPRIDLATEAIGDRPYGHVVPCSPLAPFIRHQKGINAVKLGWV
jgi:hypothetical protein